jgi:hypothetical protein
VGDDVKQSAAERDRAIDERLGTSTPNLARLEDRLYETYSASSWGLLQFGSLEDEEQRAVASDLLLSAVEGVKVNIRELALAVLEVHEHVGPNGRTMPGPDTTLDELMNMKRLHGAITDSVRAFGSTLDCLAAMAIGILGLPLSLQTASGATLLAMPELSSAAPSDQNNARADAQRCFSMHADGPPAGWLAWALELRDAVVHRGHLSQTWLPVPRSAGRRFAVRTETPAHLLVRMEPHLRGRPWQPDMLALTGPGSPDEQLVWLPEPATSTLDELRQRTVNLVEAMCTVLDQALLANRGEWLLPEKQWRLSRDTTRSRTVASQAFRGFHPGYPVPVATQMYVHFRSGVRLELAERLRQRHTGR